MRRDSDSCLLFCGIQHAACTGRVVSLTAMIIYRLRQPDRSSKGKLE